MKKTNMIKRCIFLIGTIFITSCATISYTPKVILDVSPKTINKSLMVEKLKDISPIEDRKNPFSGLSLTNEKSLTSSLELEVTNAIVSDFSNNGVFKQISRHVDNPDFILKGEIKKFMGKSKLTKYGIISLCTYVGIITWYFGIPIRANTTDIELSISLYDNRDNLVGTYSGVYKDRMTGTLYNNNALALPSQANKAFSNAVSQIREKILADISKYEK